jgi:hypothetical protein
MLERGGNLRGNEAPDRGHDLSQRRHLAEDLVGSRLEGLIDLAGIDA